MTSPCVAAGAALLQHTHFDSHDAREKAKGFTTDETDRIINRSVELGAGGGLCG
jgi:hypothetical protein